MCPDTDVLCIIMTVFIFGKDKKWFHCLLIKILICQIVSFPQNYTVLILTVKLYIRNDLAPCFQSFYENINLPRANPTFRSNIFAIMWAEQNLCRVARA